MSSWARNINQIFLFFCFLNLCLNFDIYIWSCTDPFCNIYSGKNIRMEHTMLLIYLSVIKWIIIFILWMQNVISIEVTTEASIENLSISNFNQMAKTDLPDNNWNENQSKSKQWYLIAIKANVMSNEWLWSIKIIWWRTLTYSEIADDFHDYYPLFDLLWWFATVAICNQNSYADFSIAMQSTNHDFVYSALQNKLKNAGIESSVSRNLPLQHWASLRFHWFWISRYSLSTPLQNDIHSISFAM